MSAKKNKYHILRHISEKEMATHSNTLAWKIPWMEEPGRLQSVRLLRVGHNWKTSLSLFTFYFHALEKEMATHSSAWRTPGMGEPGGLPSVGSHRVRHDWSNLAAAARHMYAEMVQIRRDVEMVQINLCSGQQWRCRCRDQTCGHRGGRRGWDKWKE